MSTCPDEIPLPAELIDRRTSPRLRLTSFIRVHIARGEGSLMNLSRGGARIRHTGGLRRGARTRLRIHLEHPLSLHCTVLASRVAELGRDEHPTVYESRIRFDAKDQAGSERLDHLLHTLESRALRRFVANMQGWQHESTPPPPCVGTTLIRVTRDGNSWLRKLTANADQPREGFTLPACTEPEEIALLCRTWEKLDADGRHLVQRLAEEAVAHSGLR